MTFTRNNTSVLHYVIKRLEIILGFGLILLITVHENILSTLIASLIFFAAILAGLPKIIKGSQNIKKTQLFIRNDHLFIESPIQKTEYLLNTFEMIMYKKSGRRITSFVIMSKEEGVKLEYYKNMDDLFLELKKHIKITKRVTWWQRL